MLGFLLAAVICRYGPEPELIFCMSESQNRVRCAVLNKSDVEHNEYYMQIVKSVKPKLRGNYGIFKKSVYD